MDKFFAFHNSCERFVSTVALDAAPGEKPNLPRISPVPVLLCGVAFLSLAIALGSPLPSDGERGGELSAAIEVIGEAIEAERQGEEY